jgi:hypothetical protein
VLILADFGQPQGQCDLPIALLIWLIEKELGQDSFLALAFTNRLRWKMVEQVEPLLGGRDANV